MKFLHKILVFIISDYKAKGISIALAIGLWYYVNILSIEKTTVTLPISVQPAPSQYKITYLNDLFVKVSLFSRDDVSAVLPELKASVDLSEATLKKTSYPIVVTNIPKGIKYEISPSKFKINIFELITNTVPIIAEYIDDNPTISITNITLKPSNAVIVGTVQQMSSIQNIKTQVFSTKDITNTNIFITNVLLNRPNGVVLISNEHIEITSLIELYHITNTVILPISPKNLGLEYALDTIPSIKLTIITPTSNIENLLLDTELSVDLSEVNGYGRQNFDLTIKTPERLKILNTPTNIELNIANNLIEEDSIFEPTTKPQNKSITNLTTKSNSVI